MSKNYAHVEGWQFAGGLMGIYPKVVSVENLSSGTEKKWKADVELIFIKDGRAVGFGSAVCSNQEGKKKSFDEYAILSMAQTRAIGKAYRNSFGWVMKLAGYEATPSEEMFKMGETPAAEPVKQETASNGEVGVWKETGEIVRVLTDLGYKTEESRLKALQRMTKGKVKGLKMSEKTARVILSQLLRLKAQKK